MPRFTASPDDPAAYSLQWLGLIGFADPLRHAVRDAVAEPGSRRARGLLSRLPRCTALRDCLAGRHRGHSDVVSGADLDAADDATLARHAASAGVFARVRPEHKLRLVERCKNAVTSSRCTVRRQRCTRPLVAAHCRHRAWAADGTDVAREPLDRPARRQLRQCRACDPSRAWHLRQHLEGVRYILRCMCPSQVGPLPLLAGSAPIRSTARRVP